MCSTSLVCSPLPPLIQGSALIPLLFTMEMELISRHIRTYDVVGKMMNADDLAIIAKSKHKLQEGLEDCEKAFKNFLYVYSNK